MSRRLDRDARSSRRIVGDRQKWRAAVTGALLWGREDPLVESRALSPGGPPRVVRIVGRAAGGGGEERSRWRWSERARSQDDASNAVDEDGRRGPGTGGG